MTAVRKKQASKKKSKKTPGSGRKKGTPNKRTQEVLDLLEEKFPDYNPIVAMAEIANDEELPIDMRMSAHKEVAQYVAPKRKAIEHSGNAGITVTLKDLSGE